MKMDRDHGTVYPATRLSYLSAMFRSALFVLLLALSTPALALEPGEALKDPALEARARALSSELRCLVCQNQSIDDSQAPLAKDLRLLVRERLTAGDSDAQVLNFLVQRYGDFILLKPPLRIGTLLLWGAPVLVLGLGALALALRARRRKEPAAAPALSREESGELERLLKQ
jgi:cytochrome c-type biogenesis protein CcmH